MVLLEHDGFVQPQLKKKKSYQPVRISTNNLKATYTKENIYIKRISTLTLEIFIKRIKKRMYYIYIYIPLLSLCWVFE